MPDTLLTLGVAPPEDIRIKEHRAYFTWIYGKSPDIVIEIVSNKEGGELDRKMRGYAQMRVPYYVVFDPDLMIQEARLRCFALQGGGSRYEEMNGSSFDIDGLIVGLIEWDGEFEDRADHWIRWVDATGMIVLTGEEKAHAALQLVDAESRRAETQAQRADTESRRAETEARRADALAAKLRELGVDPATIR